MSHVTYHTEYESCHIWMSHVMYTWVMSHINKSCHISHRICFHETNSSSCTTHTLSLSLFFSFTHTYTLSLSLFVSLSHTHTRTLSLFSLSHTHTRRDATIEWPTQCLTKHVFTIQTHPGVQHTHTLSLIHIHTNTHTNSLSLSLSLTHMHSLSLSYTHTPALTQCLDRRLNIIRNVFPQNKFIQACNILQLRVAIEQQCSMLRIR